jgi:hypothetical protein
MWSEAKGHLEHTSCLGTGHLLSTLDTRLEFNAPVQSIRKGQTLDDASYGISGRSSLGNTNGVFDRFSGHAGYVGGDRLAGVGRR